MSKMIMVDSKPIKFQIWDTAGIFEIYFIIKIPLTIFHRSREVPQLGSDVLSWGCCRNNSI